jgi:hypothetical protein
MLFTGQAQAPVNVGAALPSATAVFETSLASPISSSATTFTLAANSVRGGGSLSGFNCFAIDEGSAQAETVCGTVSGTTVSSVTRGISQSTGTTTVSALQFSHRRGANVKITDFPLIQILKAQNNGEDTFMNPLVYDSGVSTAELAVNDKNLASVEYANSLAFGAIPAASESASGFVELATQTEAASSTSSGGVARLVLPASIATSTYNQATAPLRVVVTNNSGTIDQGFMPATTTKAIQFTASSTFIGTTNALDLGKNIQVLTTTGTSSWAIPAGVKKVKVELVGGGKGGDEDVGGGGGAYAMKIFNIGATTTLTIKVAATDVGSSATCGSGGGIPNADYSAVTDGTSIVYAYGGGTCRNTAAGYSLGGVAVGGDINISGGNGAFAGGFGSGGELSIGGSSYLSTGPNFFTTASNEAGLNGSSYGVGGTGSLNPAGSTVNNGGTGAQGVVIISW